MTEEYKPNNSLVLMGSAWGIGSIGGAVTGLQQLITHYNISNSTRTLVMII